MKNFFSYLLRSFFDEYTYTYVYIYTHTHTHKHTHTHTHIYAGKKKTQYQDLTAAARENEKQNIFLLSTSSGMMSYVYFQLYLPRS